MSAAATPASPDGLAGWYTTAPQVALSASEPATISYSTTSQTGPFTDYTAPLAFTDGANTLHYRATDTAGNTSAVSSLTLDVDTSAPVAPSSIDATSSNYTSADVSWSGVGDGGSGLAYYRVYQDGSVLATATSTTYQASALSTGTTYGFQVSAVDVAGNESSRSVTATVTTSADFTAPTTTLVISPVAADGANGWYVSVPSVTMIADEPGVHLLLAGLVLGPVDFVFDVARDS